MTSKARPMAARMFRRNSSKLTEANPEAFAESVPNGRGSDGDCDSCMRGSFEARTATAPGHYPGNCRQIAARTLYDIGRACPERGLEWPELKGPGGTEAFQFEGCFRSPTCLATC